jgi:hypothetical protein
MSVYRLPPRRQGARPAASAARRGVLLAGALCCLAGGARAQLLERYEPAGVPGYPDWFTDGVKTAPDTGYEALPVHAGDLEIDPALTESAGDDSNVLNSTHPRESAFVQTSPSLHAGTTWAVDAIDVSLHADDMRYLDEPAQSTTSWTASAGGRLDLGEDKATLAFTHADTFSLPTEVGSFGFLLPIQTVIEDGRAGYEWHLGQLTLSPFVDVASYLNSGGGIAGADLRRDDRIAYTVTLALAYAVSPDMSLVLISSDTAARFDTTLPGTPTLNYNDSSVLLGLDAHPDGVLRYRALIGYEFLTYDAAGLSGASTPAAELDVVWAPTALTTLTGRLTESLQNSPGAPEGTYSYTSVHARIDHAYLRNLILNAGVDYQAADFTGGAGSQSVVTVSAGLRWQLNRGLGVTISDSFASLAAGGETSRHTTRNVATIGLTLRPGAFD